MVARRLIVLTILAAVTACRGDERASQRVGKQPSDAAWRAEQAWTVDAKPAFELRGKAESETASHVLSAFRLRDGHYVVADGGVYYGGEAEPQYVLLLYDSSGAFVRKIGRKGDGPGEFGRLATWAGVYRGDSVAGYDFDENALEIFAPDGKFGRKLSLSRHYPAQRPPREAVMQPGNFIGVLEDGRSLQKGYGVIPPGPEGPAFWENNVFVDSPDGVTLDSLPKLPFGFQVWRSSNFPQGILYGVRPTAAVGSSEWYYGSGENFSIDVFDAAGRKVRELRRPVEREEVTTADKDHYADWQATMPASMVEGAPDPKEAIKKMAENTRKNGRFADRKPAYSAILIDSDQNVWVEHYRFHADIGEWPKEAARWSVFDPSGKFLGEVMTPAGVDVKGITSDRVLGAWKDEDDVAHVSVYVLNKPRGM